MLNKGICMILKVMPPKIFHGQLPGLRICSLHLQLIHQRQKPGYATIGEEIELVNKESEFVAIKAMPTSLLIESLHSVA